MELKFQEVISKIIIAYIFKRNAGPGKDSVGKEGARGRGWGRAACPAPTAALPAQKAGAVPALPGLCPFWLLPRACALVQVRGQVRGGRQPPGSWPRPTRKPSSVTT